MTAIFEPSEEGVFIAYIEEIPGINSQGETIEEAKENLTEAINLMFEERRSNIRKNKNIYPKSKCHVKNIVTIFSDRF